MKAGTTVVVAETTEIIVANVITTRNFNQEVAAAAEKEGITAVAMAAEKEGVAATRIMVVAIQQQQ